MSYSKKYYGWSVIAASWLALFCLFGYRATFSILKVPMSADMGWSQTEVTLGYSFMMMVYALAAFGCGMILDKWGTKPVYFMGAILGAAGFYVTSMVHSLYAYYAAYGILAGAATGMLWVSSTISVRKWFVGKSYAKMFGIAFAGAPMSQVVMSLFVKQSLVGAEGDAWRGAMQLLGVLTLGCLIVAALLAKKNPEDYGMEPFGETPGASATKEYVWGIKEAFSTFPIWGAILTFLTSMLAEFLVWTQVVSYWNSDLGMSLSKATNLYVAIGVVGIFSMPIMGIVADKVVQASKCESQGRKRMLIFGPLTGVAACGLLLMQTSASTILGLIACFIFAIYWAIVPGGVVGYTGAVYGRATLGKIWGLATLIVMGIGPFIGPLIGGYLKDMSGSYTYSIIFAMCAFLVSGIIASSLPLSTEVLARAKAKVSTV
ncbi:MULTISPECIES: MFS transporter [unclassified Pseudodesulfovibrio]|uniref:MFS transporter n=1 Tax=unclassified Pseudodesulfovibrio TaxID=2661612 RepID=UPI000FEBCA1E|nr:MULTISPECIES: MFS transporter [unclassified Pseudodesulfovibrio]MCJ2163432.1 MFS transporter [Pseudodesulfovibrio sp. S3-i]RWU06669.1 MFS transporter [Pseudodesulfovibrio sp. S3]